MLNNQSVLAIIPARGGSKRLPGKNLKLLKGKPLVEWSIEAAVKSRYVDHSILTSDDDAILESGKKWGIQTLKRSAELSSDKASSIDVMLDAMDKAGQQYDLVILLQPTSPLRTAEDIDDSLCFFDEKKADAVISVCEAEHPVQFMNILKPDLNMDTFLADEMRNKRSQDMEPYYRINGAIYIIKDSVFRKTRDLFVKKNIFAYMMDQYKSVDIDTSFDFAYADFLIDYLTENK